MRVNPHLYTLNTQGKYMFWTVYLCNGFGGLFDKFPTKSNTPSLGSSEPNKLEQFILSKEPTSISDVEYWTRQYDRLNRSY